MRRAVSLVLRLVLVVLVLAVVLSLAVVMLLVMLRLVLVVLLAVRPGHVVHDGRRHERVILLVGRGLVPARPVRRIRRWSGESHFAVVDGVLMGCLLIHGDCFGKARVAVVE